MRTTLFAGLLTLAACGADGPPTVPALPDSAAAPTILLPPQPF